MAPGAKKLLGLALISSLILSRVSSKNDDSDESLGLGPLHNHHPHLLGTGLTLLLTLKGLQTITGALQNTTQKVIGHLDIPDFHKDGDSAHDHKILNFDPPQIEAKFKDATGIDVHMILPKLEALSKLKSSDSQQAGSPTEVTTKIENIVSKLIVKIKPGPNQQPIIDIPQCSTNMNSVAPAPAAASGSGSLSDKIKGLASKALQTKLPDSVCNAAKLVANSINQAFLSLGHDIPSLSDVASGKLPKLADLTAGGVGKAPKVNMTLFCGVASRIHEAKKTGKMTPKGFRSYLAGELKNVTAEIEGLVFKTKVKNEAKYTEKDMKLDIEAGFDYEDDQEAGFSFAMPTFKPIPGMPTFKPIPGMPTFKPIPGMPTIPPHPGMPTFKPIPGLPTLPPVGKTTKGSGRPPGPTSAPSPATDKDLCLSLGDQVVNSFMQRGHEQNFFNTTLNVTKDDIPAPVWNLLKLAFKDNFQMTFQLETEQAPAFHFTPSGGHSTAKLSTHFGLETGRKKEKVVDASADIDIGIRTYIDQHAVKASISLGPAPKVQMHHIFLTGLADNIASDMINLILKKVVWPHIEKKYNKMLGVGIRLPTPCGMSFLDPKIVNVEGQVKLCTNLQYDDSAFVARLKQHMDAKKAESQKG